MKAQYPTPAGATLEPLDRRVLLSAYDLPVATFGGEMDQSFGNGGWVTNLPSGQHSNVKAILPDHTGGFIVVGYTAVAETVRDFVLWRIGADGTPDLSFGTGGTVRTDFGGSDDNVVAAVMQPDGKVIAVGLSRIGTSYPLAMARFNADGSLDNTFGVGGMVRVSSAGTGHDVALLPDGKILVAAPTVDYDVQRAGLLLQFMPDGQLDASFGQGGIVTDTDFTLGPIALALQPDGKIVAGGSTLARYNPDGSRDTDFVTNASLSADSVSDLLVAPDGKIYVGRSGSLMRVTSTGKIDNTFGNKGQAVPILGYIKAERLAQLPDGRIIAVGTESLFDPNVGLGGDATVVIKIDPTGTVERHFAELGTSHLGRSGPGFLRSNVVLMDGQILVGGSTSGMNNSAAIARVHVGYPALQDGTLAVLGTERADEITLTREGSELITTTNGQQHRYLLAEVERVYVLAGDGADSVTIGDGIGPVNIYVDGERGNDTLVGGDANDTLCGGWEDDLLLGGPGNDRLLGGCGYDTLIGAAGNDRIYGGKNSDTLDGGLGRDRLWGGNGNGGESGHDYVRGGNHNDSLWGEDGNDTLQGGYHDDSLEGGDGDDFLIGFFGRDTLIGGQGSNIFYSRDGELDTLIGSPGSDRARVDPDDVLDSIDELLD